MRTRRSLKQNHLLAALPAAEFMRLSPHLERVPSPLGAVIDESGGEQDYVYFPASGIVSLLYVMNEGSAAEIAVVGKRGHGGNRALHGRRDHAEPAVVQSAGSAYRLEAAVIKAEFARGGALQRLLLRYTQALITQMTQTAVCNRHHMLEQQLCRWLLLSLDRLPANQPVMTQQLIANMLGVRREGITEAAGRLQADGLINYRRDGINVLDRAKLEERVCEC